MVTIGTTDTGLCQIEVDSMGGDRPFMAKEINNVWLKKNDNVKVTGRLGNSMLIEKI